MLVHTSWDIGVDDKTAICFFVVESNGRLVFIDYHESSGRGLDYYMEDLLPSYGYEFGRYIWPHDGRVREWGNSALRRSEVAWLNYSVKVDILPRLTHNEYIGLGRRLLKTCCFVESGCSVLLGHLQSFREEYNRKTGEPTGRAVHGPESHGAMSFIYAACAYYDNDIDFLNMGPGNLSLLEACCVESGG